MKGMLEILQSTSYGFLGPTQVYYAGARVRPADMVKGQAFITAAYSLGCSGGNFAGGQLLNFGVDTMLLAGVAMALAGTLFLFLTVNKSDIEKASRTSVRLFLSRYLLPAPVPGQCGRWEWFQSAYRKPG